VEKLQKLADRLQSSIDFATEHNEDFEDCSWTRQEGVLLNYNEAKLVVDLVKSTVIESHTKDKLIAEIIQKEIDETSTDGIKKKELGKARNYINPMQVKYIRTKEDEIIVFSEHQQHSEFRDFNPVSAGFISFGAKDKHEPVCRCYGESVSLKLKSDEDKDTQLATKQILGYG
jgi:hypothetical protein